MDGVESHDVVEAYAAAAAAVSEGVARVPEGAWDSPGLGEWTVRDLVGHTSRALVTVVQYLVRPVTTEEVRSPVDYLVAIGGAGVDPAVVAERGREAGRGLGSDPAASFDLLACRATAAARAVDPDLVVHTVAGGMRVVAYLPTRTFELCVHGLDLAAATGIALDLPGPALAAASRLAADAAVAQGQGPDLLRALTGRARLPDTTVL